MLDLETLVNDIKILAAEVVESARETLNQRQAAVEQLQRAPAGALREAVIHFGQDMALPADGFDMRSVHAPPLADDYTVIATDGSQIAPDFHHIAPWYLINAGYAVFRYGPPPGRARCSLRSFPRLRPPKRGSADPSAGHANADAQASAVGVPLRLEVERLRAELDLAFWLLDEEVDPGRTVLLLDGPLIQWRMLNELRGEERNQVLDGFRGLLRKAKETRTPIAGFISRSRSVEWVTLLRLSLCADVAAHQRPCDDCKRTLLSRTHEPVGTDHHFRLAGLRDIELAHRLLKDQPPGSRTEVIELQSKPWRQVTGDADAAGFFYLNAGPEIARVELPRWVWEDPSLMERLHAVVWDQCQLAGGYPMVLAEAHEAAVVRSPDRDAFYTLIERVLREHDLLGATHSAKATAKRRPLA